MTSCQLSTTAVPLDSGDLAPLANLFLPLTEVGDVYYKGKKCEAISVLDEFGWEPVKLMSKEGLALLNGTQFMSANGVFAMLKAFRLSKGRPDSRPFPRSL